ncbi:MAG: restriction endonuclease, partial [Deltaproteobacteria bacterium]|nr:restriction endonuclease [Deltaproteobacteria bacterium]
SWNNSTEIELDFVREKRLPLLNDLLHSFREAAGDCTGAYLVMMSARLLELRRVLKPAGSIYLHCDPTASHYLKTIMDVIFGRDNFLNEIVWKRTHSHGGARKWGAIHDNLLFYANSAYYTWNQAYTPYTEKYTEETYDSEDEDGRKYQPITLTGSGPTRGESGKPWRGIDPTAAGRHWAIPRKNLAELGIGGIPETVHAALERLDELHLIYWPKNGDVPRFKRYLDSTLGREVQDFIEDIVPIPAKSAEKLGYPTQKPLPLLERIISVSSNPGDIVLDPFCGCGTAIEAAEKLGRQWIGIDITVLAIGMIERRLDKSFGRTGLKWEVTGTPKDINAARNLAARNKFQFQIWACTLVKADFFGGEPLWGADGGIDGVIHFNDEGPKAKPKRIIVSVKGGAHVGPSMVRGLIGTVEKEKAAAGLFITLAEPTKAMISGAAKAGLYEPPGDKSIAVPKIQILRVEDLLNGHGPILPPDSTRSAAAFKQSRPVLPPVNRNPLLQPPQGRRARTP